MSENAALPIDHYLTITLSDDKLTAFLHFNLPDDNFKCTFAQLEEMLRNAHITHGIQYDVLTDFAKDPSKYLYDKIVIARGDAPIDGEDGSIVCRFDLESNVKRPAELDDGRVDYKEMNTLNNVRKGELIAEKIPPTEGQPGRAVTGELLFPRKGKEARFRAGKNVVQDESKTHLYATIDGLFTRTEREKINVFPVYEVNGDVDYRTGNIDFVGNVVVRGNVLTGFRVRAYGDIRVTGGVEGAELSADGSIDISGGILGHNKGLVQAKGSVKTSFIQDGNVEAGEDIIVQQSIMHSNIRAGCNVLCAGSKGLIVGGQVQAGEKVTARVIGNTMSTVTILEVGVLPELRNELADLRAQVKEQSDNLEKTNKALALLDQLALTGNLSADKLEMKNKLSVTRKQNVDQVEEMKIRILEIEKSLEDTSKAGVDVINTIYGGCRIVIGRYTRYIKDATQRVSFRFIDGEITMMQGTYR